ncbi:DinB family protein [Paenibacillus radicis (ex Xue et al. 2023)]|uniref:DinB family protein n=1 Tax=Paenibacillus radicis (ex Xue et al. 2023) TaxID=2972489 RepID=A0ABT1YQA5_9BACL|nr:DinB family protein [Paenibacillus radicis (ex Xue et al. 2023)]MCR8635361.1 DinB family protein [Paenibacillus radicis (ex Xue et al. 2023)]
MSQAIIQTALSARQLVLGSVQQIPEDWYDIQPDAFPNNIRWNIGHMITMMNWFLTDIEGYQFELPDTYSSIFMTGTKPEDWAAAPPSKDELLEQLTRQFNAIEKVPADVLNQELRSPFLMGPLEFKSAGEVFNFAIVHEGVHLGMISGLAKVIIHDL